VDGKVSREASFSLALQKKNYSSATRFCGVHKLQAAPRALHLGQGRYRDTLLCINATAFEELSSQLVFAGAKSGIEQMTGLAERNTVFLLF